MAQFRVLHKLTVPEQGNGSSIATQYAADLRSVDGVLAAEAFSAIDDPNEIAVVHLWESQHAYGAHWREVLSGAWSSRSLLELDPGLRDATEFYEHQLFLPDGAWVASVFADASPVVMWPARGSIRILIQFAAGDPADAVEHFKQDAADTRREPGCLEYGWFQGTEFQQDTLLLELWENQSAYDHHWNLRLKTGNAGEPPSQGRRGTGFNGIEFYRHHTFTHHYDRWLPTDLTDWSHTISWAN